MEREGRGEVGDVEREGRGEVGDVEREGRGEQGGELDKRWKYIM